MIGPLALVGGDEFQPGNEEHDRFLVGAAAALRDDRPAFVIATAAARHSPEIAVRTARDWFASLELPVEELRVRTRSQAMDAAVAQRAREGRFFYLCGGDPGIVPQVLRGSVVWAAVTDAWRAGAPLAGSSAGAMALGEWTLIRARMPGDSRREPRPGLGIVPGVAVLPHYSDFGHRWVESATELFEGRNALLLAIDAKSAAVWADGTWSVMGAGRAFVVGRVDGHVASRVVSRDDGQVASRVVSPDEGAGTGRERIQRIEGREGREGLEALEGLEDLPQLTGFGPD